MLRKVVAIIFGVIVAVVLIMIIESFGHTLYTPPDNLDFTDMEEMSAYVDGLPFGALLFVMAAWITGTLGGGLVACAIARKRHFVYAFSIAGMVLSGTVYTLTQIHHPTWFSVTSIIAILVTAWLTGQIGQKVLPGPDSN